MNEMFNKGDVLTATSFGRTRTATVLSRTKDTVTYLEHIEENGIVSEKEKTRDIITKAVWNEARRQVEYVESMLAWAKHIFSDGEYEEYLSYYYPPKKEEK